MLLMKRYRIVFGLALLDGLMSFCSGLFTQPAYAQLIIQIDITEAEQHYLETKGEIKVCVDPGRMPFNGKTIKASTMGYLEITSKLSRASWMCIWFCTP